VELSVTAMRLRAWRAPFGVCRTGSPNTAGKSWPKSPRRSIPTSRAAFWWVRYGVMSTREFGPVLLIFRDRGSRGLLKAYCQADLFLAYRHTKTVSIKAWA